MFLISTNSNNVCHYLLNPNMYIPTTYDILLFSIMLCTIVSFFGATYYFIFLLGFFFCVSKICKDYFRTLYVWNIKVVFFRILYICLFFFVIFLGFYCIPLIILVLFSLGNTQCSCLLNICSKVFFLSLLFLLEILLCSSL